MATGKRLRRDSPQGSKATPKMESQKRLKTDQREKLSVPKTDQKQEGAAAGKAKKDKDEDYEEVKQASGEPPRRSGRNLGKEANYNIDEILDNADMALNGLDKNGCI